MVFSVVPAISRRLGPERANSSAARVGRDDERCRCWSRGDERRVFRHEGPGQLGSLPFARRSGLQVQRQQVETSLFLSSGFLLEGIQSGAIPVKMMSRSFWLGMEHRLQVSDQPVHLVFFVKTMRGAVTEKERQAMGGIAASRCALSREEAWSRSRMVALNR